MNGWLAAEYRRHEWSCTLHVSPDRSLTIITAPTAAPTAAATSAAAVSAAAAATPVSAAAAAAAVSAAAGAADSAIASGDGFETLLSLIWLFYHFFSFLNHVCHSVDAMYHQSTWIIMHKQKKRQRKNRESCYFQCN